MLKPIKDADIMPTHAEAPPPSPLNKATTCGICIICTFFAIVLPISAPTIIAGYIVHALTTSLKNKVATTPQSIAKADSKFPLTELLTLLIIDMPTKTAMASRLLIIICIVSISVPPYFFLLNI